MRLKGEIEVREGDKGEKIYLNLLFHPFKLEMEIHPLHLYLYTTRKIMLEVTTILILVVKK